jgi:hypothetical protein
MSIKVIPTGVPFIPDSRSVSAAVIVPEARITEAQCVAFLTQKAREIKAKFGAKEYAVAELQIAFYGSETADPIVTARVSSGGLETIYSAPTFEQAMSEAGENSPEVRAAKKRKQAEALIAEAEKLEASAELTN